MPHADNEKIDRPREDTLLVDTPRNQKLDRKFALQLIREAKKLPAVGARLKAITQELLGRPYYINPLIGSEVEPEKLVATLDGFDCVTFLETVLALAWAKDVAHFVELLREIRYKNGEVSYKSRLHYSTDWMKANVRRGFFQDITRGEDTLVKTKTLDFLKAFQPRTVNFRYFPKRKLGKVSHRLQDGDVIMFVSTRKGIDTFHVGMIFREDERLVLRHSARSKGGVVNQDLKEFFKANTMPGFIIARPRESAPSLNNE
ncbi:MAG TPA: N-acetylmuramoyl-L-alanine amidase-like domain-containing protein [Blastocatellia bacterium]|nr:N-acetylmuramoyl-L-alanine amidase-like domain-containing protein [Blastocatellia bacterium]